MVPITNKGPNSRRVLITGASGFIGGALFRNLLAINPIGTQFTSQRDISGSQLVTVDLRDELAVTALIERFQPSAVFHFAALTSPKRNNMDPDRANDAHIKATCNILKALPENAQFVYLSTDKVFDGTYLNPDETVDTKPFCLYGELKLKCENMIRQKVEKHHIIRLPIVHSYGDEDSNSFIDDAIKKLRRNDQIAAFDNISRCYVKLDELVNFLSLLLENKDYGTYHVGSKLMSYYQRIMILCEENKIQWRDKLLRTTGEATPLSQSLSTAKAEQLFNLKFS